MQRGRPRIQGPRLPSGKLRGKMPLNQRQKRQVKSLITRNVEKRYHDSIQTGLGITGAGSWYDLSLVPVTARVGDQLTVTNLQLMLNMVFGDSTQNVRASVIQWTPNSLVQVPSIGTVFQAGGTNPIVSGFSITNEGPLFKVLYDKVFDMSSGGVGTVSRKLNFFGRRLAKKIIDQITGQTGGYNHYYLYLVSDSAAVPNPTVNFYSRVIYKDA